MVQSNVSLILWPEGAVRVLEEDEQAFIQRGQELGKAKNVYVALAYFVFPRNDPGRLGENKCVFINPDGQVEWHYLKTYPVPGSTDKPGNGKIPVSVTPFGRVGAVICYDMEFTRFINQAGKSDIDIMVVPSWDWRAIDPLHSHMATFRAVENGFSLVRQAGEGLSLSTDYLGRTQSAMDYFNSDEQVLISEVPRKGIRTVYSVIGDLLAWVCIGGLVVFLIFSAIKRNSTSV
jgi:apolipoprotein N-acyltransferase